MAIIPGLTRLTRPYWDAAREGRLVVQECHGCGQLRHPPLPACPHCHGTDQGWRQVSGEATVYSATIVRHPTHAALADQVPYVVALVELAEGPRLITGITGCPPEDVQVGLPVRVTFRPLTDDVTLPYFEPSPPSPMSPLSAPPPVSAPPAPPPAPASVAPAPPAPAPPG